MSEQEEMVEVHTKMCFTDLMDSTIHLSNAAFYRLVIGCLEQATVGMLNDVEHWIKDRRAREGNGCKGNYPQCTGGCTVQACPKEPHSDEIVRYKSDGIWEEAERIVGTASAVLGQ